MRPALAMLALAIFLAGCTPRVVTARAHVVAENFCSIHGGLVRATARFGLNGVVLSTHYGALCFDGVWEGFALSDD